MGRAAELPPVFASGAISAMDIFSLVVLTLTVAYILKAQEQRQRINLLASFLKNYQVEKLMGSLIDGYLRALGESDQERQQQIWQLQTSVEAQLCGQVSGLATALAAADVQATRVSTLGLGLPYATQWLPSASFDFREAMRLHAVGVVEAAQNSQGLPRKAQAYMMTAELLLLQHSCHWFCKSKTVASARLLARHHTTYSQVLAAVSERTRAAYLGLVQP
jgi:hypothetical protein